MPFGTHKAELLGYVEDRDGIRPSSAHIAEIKALKEPENGAELLRFLGLMNYFLAISSKILQAERADSIKFSRGPDSTAGEGVRSP